MMLPPWTPDVFWPKLQQKGERLSSQVRLPLPIIKVLDATRHLPGLQALF